MSRTYGFGQTIHGTGHVDVEIDRNGDVVAVWFRCMPLPFEQSTADKQRASEMRRMYEHGQLPAIEAVVMER
jgi:hypothetical protein